MRFWSHLITFFFLFFLSSFLVSAEPLEQQLFIESKVSISEDSYAFVKTKIRIQNNSPTYVVSSLEMFSNNIIKDLKIYKNGRMLEYEIENRKIKIDLSSSLVFPKSTGEIELEYLSPDLLTIDGSIKKIYWREFETQDIPVDVVLEINTPEAWGKAVFLSHKSLGNSESTYRFQVNEPVYLIWGSPYPIEIVQNFSTKYFDVNENALVPIPCTGFNTIGYLSAQDSIGVLNFQNNKYLLFKGSSQGIIKFSLSKSQADPQPDFSTETILAEDIIEKFALQGLEDPGMIYQKFLHGIEPVSSSDQTYRTIYPSSLEENRFNSYEYSQMLKQVYNYLNIDAEVVYGVATLPIQERKIWHYWLVADFGQGLVQMDPFLEDLLGMDFFNQMMPDRIIWGIVDNNSVYFRNIEEVPEITFGNTIAYAPPQEDVSISLENKGGHNWLKIRNNSGLIIYPLQLISGNIGNDLGYIKHIGILPGSTREYNIDYAIQDLQFGTVVLEYKSGQNKLKLDTIYVSRINDPVLYFVIGLGLFFASIAFGYVYKTNYLKGIKLLPVRKSKKT